MYIKQGSHVSTVHADNPILKTPEGQGYEVSFVAAFIWQYLDGKTSIEEVSQKLKVTGNVDSPNLTTTVQKIAVELKNVGLLREIKHEAHT